MDDVDAPDWFVCPITQVRRVRVHTLPECLPLMPASGPFMGGSHLVDVFCSDSRSHKHAHREFIKGVVVEKTLIVFNVNRYRTKATARIFEFLMARWNIYFSRAEIY